MMLPLMINIVDPAVIATKVHEKSYQITQRIVPRNIVRENLFIMSF